MPAEAYGTGRIRYHGFDGIWGVTAFALGVAAVVLGALVLADGILAYASVTGMPSYLNVATVIFGNLVWWVDIAIGVGLAAVGGAAIWLSRPMRASAKTP